MKKVLPMVLLLIAVFAVDAFAGGYINFRDFFNTYCRKVPEPGTIILLGAGLAGVVGYGRKYFKK